MSPFELEQQEERVWSLLEELGPFLEELEGISHERLGGSDRWLRREAMICVLAAGVAHARTLLPPLPPESLSHRRPHDGGRMARGSDRAALRQRVGHAIRLLTAVIDAAETHIERYLGSSELEPQALAN